MAEGLARILCFEISKDCYLEGNAMTAKIDVNFENGKKKLFLRPTGDPQWEIFSGGKHLIKGHLSTTFQVNLP